MCEQLSHPENGMVMDISNSTHQIVQYMCDAGYTLNGDDTRVCDCDGKWTGYNATCEGIHKDKNMSTILHVSLNNFFLKKS